MALTKIVASRSGHRTTLIPFSGIVDDGSTLSLDFTTGVLDPRLTFTRSTNATFINSSGKVEIAGANMFRNSVLVGGGGSNTPPTSWTNAFNGATYTVANNEVKIETNAGGSARAYMYANYFGSSASGLRYTIKFVVTARTGSAYRLDELVGLPSNPPVSGTEQWSVNGTSQPNNYTGWGVGDTITYSAVTTGGSSFFPSIGCGIFNALGSTTSVTITRPQMNLGSTASAYYANSSTSAGYHDVPRFDYDPTSIGTPRGLLIEGSATNLINWSETFDTTGGATNWNWSSLNVTRGTVTTTNPTGASATVIKVEETTTNGLHSPLTILTVQASTPYTFSVWAKAVERTFVQLLENGGSNANSMVNLSTGNVVSESTSGITTVTPFGTTGWYRISMRLTTIVGQTSANCQLRLSTNGTTTSYAGTTGSGIYIWGAQFETGSGASSYIPTGASTGTRNVENCYMDGANFSSWYQNATAGTMYCEWDHPRCDRNVAHQPTPISLGSYVAGDLIAFSISNYSVGISGYGAIWGSGGTGFQSATVPTSVSVTTGNKSAFAFSGQSVMGGFRSNASALAATTGTVNAKTVLYIGGSGVITGSPSVPTLQRDFMNSCIQRIKFFPTQFTAAQLQSLTT